MARRAWVGIGIGILVGSVADCGARTELDEKPLPDPSALGGRGGLGETGGGAGGDQDGDAGPDATAGAGGSAGAAGSTGTGGKGGFGGSAGKGGGAGGRGGGAPGNPLLDILPGVRQTPQCSRCVDQSCASVATCSAAPACLTGVSCAVSSCLASGMNQLCLLRCFGGDTRQLGTAVNAVQCVYGTCGTVCTSGPSPFAEPWSSPDPI